jgi:hypothetical protein
VREASAEAGVSLEGVATVETAAEASAYEALQQRTFAAGTIGTRILLIPAPTEERMTAILVRLREDPMVEHAEEILRERSGVELRVTLRSPLRWEPFCELLERALGEPIKADRVSWSRWLLRIALLGDKPQQPA